MDFSKLITRTQYETVARNLGHRGVATMSYAELEAIAGAERERQRALYRRSLEANTVPHSFVLADVFDCAAHSSDVPAHLLENEPDVVPVTCGICHGEGWLEGEWLSIYSTRDGCHYPATTHTVCHRCNGTGETLDIEPEPTAPEVCTEAVELRKAA